MHKLDIAIDMLTRYKQAANEFAGYRGSCVLTATELNTIVSLLEDARTELVLDLVRAPG